MNGYINIKANEIPFYIPLAEDGMKKHHEFGNINNVNYPWLKATGLRATPKGIPQFA